jgi:hypothetical protein
MILWYLSNYRNFLDKHIFPVIKTHRDIKSIGHTPLKPLIPVKGRLNGGAKDRNRDAYTNFDHCNKGCDVAILYAFLFLIH